MTATILTNADTDRPQSAALTFILATNKLVTLRYVDPVPFQAFAKRRDANLQRYQTPSEFLGGLVDAIIERIADILEGAGARLDGLSARIFGHDNSAVAIPLKDRLAQARDLAQRVEIVGGRGAVGDLDAPALFEVGRHALEIVELHTAIEDLQHGAID